MRCSELSVVSALIIVVPEAEPYVRELRQQYDPVATQGMPAHITITVPFMLPEDLGETELDSLASLFRGCAPFDFALREVRRFPQTAYLAPTPVDPFIDITERALARFPAYPPYGGAFSQVVPHLTVADKSAAHAESADGELNDMLLHRGPIRSSCAEVHLFENSSGSWRELTKFGFSSGDARQS